jgi:hypothetical protein
MRSLLIISALFTTLISGCRKDDNPRVPDFIRVPLPILTKDETKDLSISAQEPTAFAASFTIDMQFKDQPPPKSVEAVMIKNGDKTNVISLLKDITSYPTTIDITGQQLIDAFGGGTIELGDTYDFGVNITLDDGTVIPAFPPNSTAYAPGVGNQPGASPSIRYEAICAFTAAEYAGNFEVEVDEWEDYAPGTIIPVTVVDETTLSFKYAADNAQPILVKVDPATNETSVAEQVYGDYDAFGISNIKCASVAGADNFVAPCDLVLSVKLRHFVPEGSYSLGSVIRLKKVN